MTSARKKPAAKTKKEEWQETLGNMSDGDRDLESGYDGPRRLFWAAVCLSVTLVALKASHLGLPPVPGRSNYLQALAAISYRDVLFVAALWGVARTLLALAWNRRAPSQVVLRAFIALSAVACLYTAASVAAFSVLGGFLTYPLLELMGNVRMLRSSVAVYLTPGVAFALVSVPLVYLGLVWITARRVPSRTPASRWRSATSAALIAVWCLSDTYVTPPSG